MSWFKKIKDGLSKTSSSVSSKLTEILTHKTLDPIALEELEELLIATDLGVKTSADIVGLIAKSKFDQNITTAEIKEIIANKIADILKPVAKPLIIGQRHPQVILVCGVNGNGKTTTLGKLAAKLQLEGKKVMLAACDTFRAAAVGQLEVWAKRANCQFFGDAQTADPASVAYKALEKAIADGIDVLLIDTAGRLHNKANLMDELVKICKVLKKIDPSAPHDVVLVLDATTGQNALQQVATFKELIGITGLIITKLDGTAKGGIVVALAQKFALPIHAIGVGEKIDDLGEFMPDIYAKSLVS